MVNNQNPLPVNAAEPSHQLPPTDTLRAWMAILLGQLESAMVDLDLQVEIREKELAQLRSKHARAREVTAKLRESIRNVDNALKPEREPNEKKTIHAAGQAVSDQPSLASPSVEKGKAAKPKSDKPKQEPVKPSNAPDQPLPG